MPHLCNSCCGYCYRFQRHTVTTTGSCAMASFYFPALRYVFLRLDSPAYQKCQPTPWHFEMKTAKSLAFITSVRAAITKRKKKKKKEQRASLSYFFVHCLRWDRREKNVPCKPRPDHSKCSSQAILWGKNNTTLSARCACVCAQTLSRRNKVREKSVADTLATTTRRALTRSWLVRQVSSVLPLTAGKTEMAP